MDAQKRWVEILKPDKSMLKFRLPYNHPEKNQVYESFEYLEGDIFLPVW